MKLEHFTIPQLIEIAKALNLPYDHLTVDTVVIRYGDTVKKGDAVWWRSWDGPKFVNLLDDSNGTHWTNVKNYPELYQLEKPEMKTCYVD